MCASSTASASTTSSSRPWPAPWAGRSRRSSPRDRRERRGHYVRCGNCGYAANVEAVQVPAPTRCRVPRRPRARRVHPESPTIAALVARLNGSHPGTALHGGEWAATDTLKTYLVMPVHPDGTREPLAMGIPGTGGRRQTARRAGRARAVESVRGEDFAPHPALVGGYMGPTVLGAESATGIRFLVDPRVVDGPGGSPVAMPRHPRGRPRRGARLHARRRHRGRPRCVRATRARRVAKVSRRHVGSRWATSSQLGRSTPKRST